MAAMLKRIASAAFVAIGIFATPSAANAADCVQTPPLSPHVFNGTVVSIESSGRVASVRTDDGADVRVIGTPSETGVTTVDRTYKVGARYEFHPLNASSPFQDNACTRTRQIAAREDPSPWRSGLDLGVGAAILLAALGITLFWVRRRRQTPTTGS
jgi:hypothetical protein